MRNNGDFLYNEKNYWDVRFLKEENYEWLANFESFKYLLLHEMKLNDRILHVGCGTSQLSHHLFKEYKNIINVDFSDTLISRESKLHPEMEWICDDMRSLKQIPSSSIDVVIEKASIEAILSQEKSQWTISENGQKDLNAVYSAIHRVLKPDGLFISISFTQPYFKVPYLVTEPYLWDCRVEKFGDTFEFFCYKMKKDRIPDMHALENYLRVTKR